MDKMYHVFCEGDNVLFRDDADYISFNNRLAISSYQTRLSILAESIMSTHFHIIVETSDDKSLNTFTASLKQFYAYHYSRKYGYSVSSGINISSVHIDSVDMAKTEILYVLKNPMHHYVCPFPLQYEYSSAQYMFMENLVSRQVINAYMTGCTKVENLIGRRMRKIIGTAHIPGNWLVTDAGMILPSSFVNMARARAFWNSNIKSFLYDINKNNTDARKEIISRDVLDLRTAGEDDIAVCKIIDNFVQETGKSSFHHLDSSEIQHLTKQLSIKRIPDMQIRRCLWL